MSTSPRKSGIQNEWITSLLFLRSEMAVSSGTTKTGTFCVDPGSSGSDQALSALLNLGYARAQAERVVAEAAEEAGADASLESLVRAALRRLAR